MMTKDMYIQDAEIKERISMLRKIAKDRKSNIREGQALFTYAVQTFPELIQLHNTETDCFNDDTKIDAFLTAAIKIWQKKHIDVDHPYGLCFRCENRIKWLERQAKYPNGNNHTPRAQCQSYKHSSISCYAYNPVKQITFNIAESEKQVVKKTGIDRGILGFFGGRISPKGLIPLDFKIEKFNDDYGFVYNNTNNTTD
jgi:hypothetical protein